ncbi:MAG: helix-turn-helix transcriptional regulator [Candidatus Ruminococcus intestinipullorum]|nr:helix-turn-helix transcriptional regulator [Candidatus Ruminococcus intestinipullorum]
MSNIQLVKNLHRLRKAHGYTQKQISERLNISRQAYSNYETGKRAPDLDSLIRLADLYHISLDELVNQIYDIDHVIYERKGPFTPAMEIENADTIYLTKEEVELLQKYRMLSCEDRLLLKRFFK